MLLEWIEVGPNCYLLPALPTGAWDHSRHCPFLIRRNHASAAAKQYCSQQSDREIGSTAVSAYCINVDTDCFKSALEQGAPMQYGLPAYPHVGCVDDEHRTCSACLPQLPYRCPSEQKSNKQSKTTKASHKQPHCVHPIVSKNQILPRTNHRCIASVRVPARIGEKGISTDCTCR